MVHHLGLRDQEILVRNGFRRVRDAFAERVRGWRRWSDAVPPRVYPTTRHESNVSTTHRPIGAITNTGWARWRMCWLSGTPYIITASLLGPGYWRSARPGTTTNSDDHRSAAHLGDRSD